MSVPGASSTVLEAVVPYSRQSLVQLLGKVFLINPIVLLNHHHLGIKLELRIVIKGIREFFCNFVVYRFLVGIVLSK